MQMAKCLVPKREDLSVIFRTKAKKANLQSWYQRLTWKQEHHQVSWSASLVYVVKYSGDYR